MKARGKTVIVVHHDLNTVPQYFDWVTMVNKQTVAYGPVAETFTDEAIERTYGKGRIVSTILQSYTDTDGIARHSALGALPVVLQAPSQYCARKAHR